MMVRLMLVAAVAVVTFAQPGRGPGPGGMGPGGMGPGAGAVAGQPRTPAELKTALGLTDAQVTSLTQVQEQKRTELQTVRQQIGEKQQALQAAMKSDNPDANAIAALLVQMNTLRKQVDSIASGYTTKAVQILDTAQKTKLADLQKAQALQQAVRQAEMFDLLARPEGAGPGMGMGPMGPGAGMGAGMGPMRMRNPQ